MSGFVFVYIHIRMLQSTGFRKKGKFRESLSIYKSVSHSNDVLPMTDWVNDFEQTMADMAVTRPALRPLSVFCTHVLTTQLYGHSPS